MSLSFVNEAVSALAAYRLYLPQERAVDRRRRRVTGDPSEIRFQTKWEVALEEIDTLPAEGLPEAPIVADAGYRTAVELRGGPIEVFPT